MSCPVTKPIAEKAVAFSSQVCLTVFVVMICVTASWLQCEGSTTRINCVAYGPTGETLSVDDFVRQTFFCSSNNCSTVIDHECWHSIVAAYTSQQDCPASVESHRATAVQVLPFLFLLGSLGIFVSKSLWLRLNWAASVVLLLLLIVAFTGSSPTTIPIGSNLPCSIVDQTDCLVRFGNDEVSRLITGRYAVLDLQENWRMPTFSTLTALVGVSILAWINYRIMIEVKDCEERSRDRRHNRNETVPMQPDKTDSSDPKETELYNPEISTNGKDGI
jgi:hypothetical protein